MRTKLRDVVTSGGSLWRLVRKAATAWSEDDAPTMGAALAYYSVFSAAPLLLIVIGVAGLALGREAASGQVFAQLRGIMGDDGASLIQTMVKSVGAPSQGILAMVVGIATLLLGATTVLVQLQSALDRVWKAQHSDGKSAVPGQIHSRVVSFLLVLGIGVLLFVSVAVSAVLFGIANLLAPLVGLWGVVLLQVANVVVSAIVFTGLFALVYKLLPRAKVSWHDVWVGAGITAVLFTLGKFLIGLYLGKSSVASGFGVAGSLAVVLVWVYYSAQIFLYGAELTWIYAHEFGSRHGQHATTASQVPVAARKKAASSPAWVARAPVAARTTAFLDRSPRLELGLTVGMGVAAALAALLRRRGHDPGGRDWTRSRLRRDARVDRHSRQ